MLSTYDNNLGQFFLELFEDKDRAKLTVNLLGLVVDKSHLGFDQFISYFSEGWKV